ncbi:MAG: DUF2378 family protein [Myxococcota bacterium]
MFIAPDFTAPVDVEALVQSLPKKATVKGMFFRALVGGTKFSLDRRYLPFIDYPAERFLRAAVEIAAKRYPRRPVLEALRRLGWEAYPVLADSMIGKVIFGVLRDDLNLVFENARRGYQVSIQPAVVRSEAVGTDHWRIHYEELYIFVDSYQVGVVEGCIRHFGRNPEVRIDLSTATSAILDVSWL